MPELPDIALYQAHVERRIQGHRLTGVRLKSPFLLRSVEPPLGAVFGRRATGVERLGKRIVLCFEDELYLVLHLMIAGRLRWGSCGAGLPGRIGLAALDFESGSLLVTEAGSRRRASLHVVQGQADLAAHDPGGLEVLQLGLDEFRAQLRGAAHTLKRTLTDPKLFSGIGNAFSDEILHDAQLSPFKPAPKLSDAESEQLWKSCRRVLQLWSERLAEQCGDAFPSKVTAFRPEMAVHGRFGKPCPVCASAVQRIVYASRETNYCARCQTGGKLLKDRALSRLLRDSWPSELDED